MPIGPGVYPAAVTPMDARQKVDENGLAKLLAWFESAGCRGAVLAGTNGEGPSLSAVEKRDLIAAGMNLRGKLEMILGIATPSLEEAIWLCRRAGEAGSEAVLLMPPGYFREASEEAILKWFEAVMDKSPIPVIVYNFPQRTGITISAGMMERLGRHANMIGTKDSSGDEANLAGYRGALDKSKVLYVGNETLLISALEQGWTGTISGAANSVPHWLSQIVGEWGEGTLDSAREKFEILLPVLEAIRTNPQPAGHKAVLHAFGVLSDATLRLPLSACPPDQAQALLTAIEAATGIRPDSPLPPAP